MKRKSKSKNKESMILAIMLLALFFAITLYWMGFHNMDYSCNVDRICLKYNLSISELNNKGEIWSLEDAYINGLRQQTTAFIMISLISIGLLISSINKLIENKNENKI